jgi:hypothetical protein
LHIRYSPKAPAIINQASLILTRFYQVINAALALSLPAVIHQGWIPAKLKFSGALNNSFDEYREDALGEDNKLPASDPAPSLIN